jgi:hypothetical protein
MDHTGDDVKDELTAANQELTSVTVANDVAGPRSL